MKKMLLLHVILAVSVSISTAQKLVVLESNGTTTVFGGLNPFIDAYAAAASGDTLYLSGGNFNAPGTIDKGLVIIGAGYSPAHTTVTQKTYIMSASRIKLGDNCTNLYLEGMEFQQGLEKLSEVATNITIVRCKLTTGLEFNGIISDQKPTSSAIYECDINGSMYLKGFTYSVISNCIIRCQINYSRNNIFRNNVILFGFYDAGTYYYTILSSSYNTFNNNIFSTYVGPCGTPEYTSPSTFNNFRQNIFYLANPNLGNSPTDALNYKNINLSTVYVNAAGGDYHLLEAAKLVYLGDDGTEVGIYGGMMPWKEGAIPKNPHITDTSVGVSTENPGYLNILFKVSAQQN